MKINLFGKDNTYLGYAEKQSDETWNLYFPNGSLAVRGLKEDITVKTATRWLIVAKTKIYC